MANLKNHVSTEIFRMLQRSKGFATVLLPFMASALLGVSGALAQTEKTGGAGQAGAEAPAAAVSATESAPQTKQPPQSAGTPVPTSTETVSPGTTPTPTGTPGVVSTPTPTGTPGAQSAVGKETSKEAPKEDFHAKTPAILTDKLSIGIGFGLGTGKGPGSDYSSDRIGFAATATYPVLDLPVVPGGRIVAEVRYATFTGVDVSADVSRSVQLMLVGGGLESRLPQLEKLRLIGTGLVGLNRTWGINQDTSRQVGSGWGASFGVNGRAAYSVWRKIEVYGGVGSQLGKYSWHDVQLGLIATF